MDMAVWVALAYTAVAAALGGAWEWRCHRNAGSAWGSAALVGGMTLCLLVAYDPALPRALYFPAAAAVVAGVVQGIYWYRGLRAAALARQRGTDD